MKTIGKEIWLFMKYFLYCYVTVIMLVGTIAIVVIEWSSVLVIEWIFLMAVFVYLFCKVIRAIRNIVKRKG